MPAKILVVDDDPDIIDALDVLLQGEGYEVITAGDGEEGLLRIKEESPDLIILDLLMPKLDGYGVCKTLREDVSQRRYELETGMRMNVEDYVEKPIDPDVVLDRVTKILARRE
jgi:two-component system alkaline phosphatase synthesis response regulator PhoP